MTVSKKIFGGLALLVTVGLCASGYLLMQYRTDAGKNKTVSKPAQEVLAEAKAQQEKGQDDAAKKTLKNFLATDPGRTDRYRSESQLATVYVDESDFTSAVLNQKQAIKDALNPNYDDYLILADDALQAKDKATALQAYKDALSDVQRHQNFSRPGTIPYLKGMIKELGGS